MKLMETFDKWAMDGTMVLIGVMILVGIFIACFFLKTFWGQWDNQYKQDEIYGKPGVGSGRGNTSKPAKETEL